MKARSHVLPLDWGMNKKEGGGPFLKGSILFLLTPARMAMAAASPMRSSFRLGWGTSLCNPTKTKNYERGLRERRIECG